jgi:hypothetical protein
MPIDNLKDSILTHHFVTYLTVQPIEIQLTNMWTDEIRLDNTELWFTGWLSQFIDEENRSERMVVLNLLELVEKYRVRLIILYIC